MKEREKRLTSELVYEWTNKRMNEWTIEQMDVNGKLDEWTNVYYAFARWQMN